MRPYWEAATYVIETLTMKLAPLDKDGLDLVFTIGQQKPVNRSGSGAAKAFAKIMEQKKPPAPRTADEEAKTDMAETFGIVFEDFLRSYKSKRMTLLVLTDGLWRGSRPERPVEEKIANFVRKAQSKSDNMEERRFSISFIRFGDYPDAIGRLTSLDDDFSSTYKVP
jgi:hypothetical protein